jgi:hypothetical protein
MNLFFLDLVSTSFIKRRESVVEGRLPNDNKEGKDALFEYPTIYNKNGGYKLSLWNNSIIIYNRNGTQAQIIFFDDYLKFFLTRKERSCPHIEQLLSSLNNLPSFQGYDLIMRTCIRR